MDTWERLKIVGAFTGTVLVFFGIHWIDDLAYPREYAARPGYRVPGVDQPSVDLASLQRAWPAGLAEHGGGRENVREYMTNIRNASVPRNAEAPQAAPAPTPHLDLATLLAAANAQKGQQTAQVCMACHTFDQGGQDRIGPSLWGVVGRNVAARKTFSYSSALAGQTGAWTYDRLDRWLTNPAKAVPGTKMAFAGLHNDADRANVIAYLSTLSASPVPFPKAKSASAAGDQPQGAPAGRG
jgi:cytochrome c